MPGSGDRPYRAKQTCHCLNENCQRQLLEDRERFEKEYGSKLETEIQKLTANTSTELDKWNRIVNESLQREILSLQESNKFLDKSREEALRKVKNLEIKYHNLLIEMKKFELTDSTRVAGFQTELKLKKFESDRTALLLAELEQKYESVSIEKEKLTEKLDIMKEELGKVRIDTEQKLNSLKMQLYEKTSKLNNYEQLEGELDQVILQAATLKDSNEAEQLLEAYGGSIIPYQPKARLKQSLELAKRVIELENRAAEFKESLFEERNEKELVRRELDTLKSTISMANRPTGELLNIILKRDTELQKNVDVTCKLKTELKEVIEQLENTKKSLLAYCATKATPLPTNHELKPKPNSGTNVSAAPSSLMSNQAVIKGIDRTSSENIIHFTKALTLSKISRSENPY